MTLFSIIVPVFNAIGTLDECLNSVFEQQEQDVEIILVDDGSNDGSQMLCDRYADHYEVVKVAHQENSGVSTARNKGLACAAGEWIIFLDSDDCLESNALATLKLAVNDSIDAVLFGYRKIDSAGNILEVHPGVDGVGDSEETARQILLPEGVFHGFVGNKCIRASLLRKMHIAFIEQYKYCEDEEWLLRAAKYFRKSVFLVDTLYIYRVSSSSASAFREIDETLLSGVAAREDIVANVSSTWPNLTGLAIARQRMFLDELSRRVLCLGDEQGLAILKAYDTGRILLDTLRLSGDVSFRIKAKAVFWELLIRIPVPFQLKSKFANAAVTIF